MATGHVTAQHNETSIERKCPSEVGEVVTVRDSKVSLLLEGRHREYGQFAKSGSKAVDDTFFHGEKSITAKVFSNHHFCQRQESVLTNLFRELESCLFVWL